MMRAYFTGGVRVLRSEFRGLCFSLSSVYLGSFTKEHAIICHMADAYQAKPIHAI